MTLPTLEAFASATLDVIAEGSIESYAPTFVFDADLLSLEPFASDIDPRVALQDHANRSGWADLEFLFGVRCEQDVVLGHYDAGAIRFLRIDASAEAPRVEPMNRPDWWWLGP